ncbi:hypothetical protein F7725_018663 [Dissostichus mawsoni]|uniref:Uncharacterized protein n=1 Tax=Dissostichus mawsoni TaxID=36200 RepID=A0A7J5XS30_DISMA|nr:hypothetical protein F7725_018663 [Dissostichus mawsoni]
MVRHNWVGAALPVAAVDAVNHRAYQQPKQVSQAKNAAAVVSQGTAILVDRHPNIVEEVEGVEGELGLGREEMSESAEGEVDDERGQQVGPHIEGLVVPLEEGEEVIAPALVRLSVAAEDVALTEHPGNIGHLHGARQRGERRLQQLRDLTQLLHVDKQAANLFHHHRRHGKLEAREEGGKEQRQCLTEMRLCGMNTGRGSGGKAWSDEWEEITRRKDDRDGSSAWRLSARSCWEDTGRLTGGSSSQSEHSVLLLPAALHNVSTNDSGRLVYQPTHSPLKFFHSHMTDSKHPAQAERGILESGQTLSPVLPPGEEQCTMGQTAFWADECSSLFPTNDKDGITANIYSPFSRENLQALTAKASSRQYTIISGI